METQTVTQAAIVENVLKNAGFPVKRDHSTVFCWLNSRRLSTQEVEIVLNEAGLEGLVKVERSSLMSVVKVTIVGDKQCSTQNF